MQSRSGLGPHPLLHGERITLRRPRPGDGADLGLLARSSASVYGEFAPPLKSQVQFGDYLQRCRREDFFGFLICRREDGVILGNINLFHIILQRMRSACVGYFIGVPHHRQGYATEALQLVLRFAFRELKLHRVEASIQPRNTPSIALVRRAGFLWEGMSRRYLKISGRWRDHERWALLAEEWRPRPAQPRGVRV